MRKKTMSKFKNRKDAGLKLSEELLYYKNVFDVIILAIPHGGIPVAKQIAQKLNAPLAAFQPKLWVREGIEKTKKNVVIRISVPETDLKQSKPFAPLTRKNRVFLQDEIKLWIEKKTIILVDDGIATGTTINQAIKQIKQFQPEKLTVCVPVAPPEVIKDIMENVDDLICLKTPDPFYGIGSWYEKFGKTQDKEIHEILEEI